MIGNVVEIEFFGNEKLAKSKYNEMKNFLLYKEALVFGFDLPAYFEKLPDENKYNKKCGNLFMLFYCDELRCKKVKSYDMQDISELGFIEWAERNYKSEFDYLLFEVFRKNNTDKKVGDMYTAKEKQGFAKFCKRIAVAYYKTGYIDKADYREKVNGCNIISTRNYTFERVEDNIIIKWKSKRTMKEFVRRLCLYFNLCGNCKVFYAYCGQTLMDVFGLVQYSSFTPIQDTYRIGSKEHIRIYNMINKNKHK